MRRAVKPFVVVEKHDLRPDAEPIVGVRWLEFNVASRCEDGNSVGPERGIDGLFHDSRREGSEEGVLRDGGAPRIPPSINFTREGDSVVNKVSILRAERGEMALRSR